jgi:mandelate racemase
LKALKLRLGYSTLAEDPAALDAVRSRVGTDIEIMVDYDQALTPAEALNRCYALDHRGIFWIEEPIAHDD